MELEEGGGGGPPKDIDAGIKKYWKVRHSLFSLFDLVSIIFF